jgi:membrane-associated protease RseP (regulator of RpoE activity)
MSTYERFKNELVAGGSVTEKPDDELAGGWRGAAGILALVTLLALLAAANIWWFVFVVGVLVAIFMHELGHFVTARWTGMKATQFFIGIGPRVWSFRRGETEYGIRAVPIAAFVRIIGMNNMDEVPPEDEARTYRQQTYPRRMLVITAGSIMHMLMAIVLLFTVYVIDGETAPRDGADIAVADNGPADVAGLLDDDIVVAVDGQRIEDAADLAPAIQANRPGDTITVQVLRDGSLQTIDVPLGSNPDESSPNFGKAYAGVAIGRAFETIDHGIAASAVNAVTDIGPTAWQSVQGVVKVLNPVNVITHLSGDNDDLETRPTTLVGVTSVSDDVGRAEGFIGILYLLAVLNVFVGVFNMFPLLPLDGGHAAIATYERLKERDGRRYFADVSKLMPVTMVVMTVLAFLFLSGLYLDLTSPIG